MMPLRLQLRSLSVPSDCRYDGHEYYHYHLKHIQKLLEQKLSNDLCSHGAQFALYFSMGIHGTS